MTRIAGAVLAAGAGSRMGRPKAEVVADGRRLLDRAVDALRNGGCDPVLAVVRPGTEVIGATAVINPEPERGQRSSLALAVDAAVAAGADAMLLLLVDLPGVGADAVRAVAGAWRPGRVTRGTYAGAGAAHPLAMGMHSWFRALEVADEDGGARPYLRANWRLIDDVAVDGDPRDLDTPDDLERWHRR